MQSARASHETIDEVTIPLMAEAAQVLSTATERNAHGLISLEESYCFCEQNARNEARNFYWSFRLLPKPKRRAMCALYAFMRHTDDIADAPGNTESKNRQLTQWRDSVVNQLEGRSVSSGHDTWPGFAALVQTVRLHGIPTPYLLAVIDGMRLDLGSVRIQTDDEFVRYCWHVASVVGLCCLHIWGFDSENGKAERLAEQLGLAFQRTNILRDIAEDYAIDRVYLPSTWLLRHGVRIQELGLPTATENLRNLVREQTGIARADYESAQQLLPLVDPASRPMLRAIYRIYESILDQIEQNQFDVLSQRAHVPKWRKIWIMIRSIYA